MCLKLKLYMVNVTTLKIKYWKTDFLFRLKRSKEVG